MVADHGDGKRAVSRPKHDIAKALLTERSIDAVTWQDWQRLDEWERKAR